MKLREREGKIVSTIADLKTDSLGRFYFGFGDYFEVNSCLEVVAPNYQARNNHRLCVRLNLSFIPPVRPYYFEELNLNLLFDTIHQQEIYEPRSLDKIQSLEEVVVKRNKSEPLSYLVYNVERDLNTWQDSGKNIPYTVFEYLQEKGIDLSSRHFKYIPAYCYLISPRHDIRTYKQIRRYDSSLPPKSADKGGKRVQTLRSKSPDPIGQRVWTLWGEGYGHLGLKGADVYR